MNVIVESPEAHGTAEVVVSDHPTDSLQECVNYSVCNFIVLVCRREAPKEVPSWLLVLMSDRRGGK